MNNVTFECGECSTKTAIVDPSCNLIKCSECKDVFDWKTGASVDMGDSQLTNCPHCDRPNTHRKKNTKPVCLNCHTIYNTPKINSTETKDEDMTREERLTALFAHAYKCINTKKDRSEDEYFKDTRFLDCFSIFIKNQVTTLKNEGNIISVAFKGEE